MERPRADRGGDRAVLARRRPLVPGRGRGAEGSWPPGCSRCSWTCPPTPGPPACAAAASCCAWPAAARGARARARGPDHAADRQPGPVHRQQVRIPAGQGAAAGQQPVRQARRPLPAGHLDRPGLPPAVRRRAREAGVLRPRDGRDGRDQRARSPSAGRAAGMQIAHRAPSRADPGERRPGGRGRAGGRHRDRGRRRCSPAPTRSGRSSSWSSERNCPSDFRAAVGGIKMDGPCAQGQPGAGRRAAGARHARRRRPGPPGAVHPAARPRRSPTHATTMPNEASWPMPTSCSSTAWSRPPWTPRWPRPAATS